MKTKDIAINITITLVAILVVFTVFEISIRALYGKHLSYDVDGELYWKLRPDQNGYQVIGFPKAEINSQGFRGEGVQDKPFNIFMLGDSYTFGQGVRDNETFPYLLDEKISDEDVQVINLGTPGWGLFQENATLHRNYEKYKPEIVVLTLLEGDLARLKFDDKSQEEEYLQRAKIRSYFRDISSFSFLKQKLGSIFKTSFGATENYVEGTPTEDVWPKNAPHIDSIYDFTQEKNVTLILVLYERGSDTFQNLITEYVEGKDIILINDFYDRFDAFNSEELIVKGEGHPSYVAHEIVAQRIFEEVEGIIKEK